MTQDHNGASFDRLRPRPPRAVKPVGSIGHDAQGKRSLFSAVSESSSPGFGSATVECSRCGERSVLKLGEAVRAMLPSLNLGLRIGRGDGVKSLSVLKHDYPTYMRCPACCRPSWTRVTWQLQI